MAATLARMEKEGKLYLRLALILMGLHTIFFILLYLRLPDTIPMRLDMDAATEAGPKYHLIWIELFFLVVFVMLLWSQRNQKEMKFNMPVKDANRENLYIAARWMIRRILLWVTIVITLIMVVGLLSSAGDIAMPGGLLGIFLVIGTLVIVFHSMMKMQDANAGRIKQ